MKESKRPRSEAPAGERFQHLPQAVVRRSWAQFAADLSADLREDCLVAAELALLSCLPRLDELPEAEQVAYATTTIRHAVESFLRARSDERAGVVFYEELSPAARERAEAGETVDTTADAVMAGLPIWDQVVNPRLRAALPSLRPEELEMLDWHFRLEWSDAEIAAILGTTPAAVQQRRSRLLVRLRELWGIAGGGGRPRSR